MYRRLGFLSVVIYSFSTLIVSASNTGIDQEGRLIRKACIQIVRHNPLAEETQDASTTPSETYNEETKIPEAVALAPDTPPLGYNEHFTKYKDPFGFSKTCVYHISDANEFDFTPSEIPGSKGHYAGGTHGYYLQQLALYKQSNFIDYADTSDLTKCNNAKRNLLLVRMRINTEYEYLFGIFASGVADFSTKDQPSIDKVKDGIVGSLKKLTLFDQFPSDAFTPEVIKELLIRSDYYLAGKFYKIKTFPIVYQEHAQRLAPTCLKKDEAISTTTSRIQSRLFSEAPYCPNTLENCAEASFNRSRFTERMFGRSAYCHFINETGDDKVCFIDDVDFCFCQSEQSFMSFLEDENEDEEPLFEGSIAERSHIVLGGALPKDTPVQIANIRIDMYSTLDICRYCRGTFSHMLENGKLKRTLATFFQRRGVTGLDINNALLEMYAFSNNETNTR